MAGTLSHARHDGIVAESEQQAIEMIFNSKYHTIIIYSSVKKKLDSMIAKIYEAIKEANKSIENIDDQWLPTSPYYWDDIDGCLAVTCAEISMDVFKEAAGRVYIFGEPVYRVLTDPSARKPLSSKAMTTLAMLGHMMSGDI